MIKSIIKVPYSIARKKLHEWETLRFVRKWADQRKLHSFNYGKFRSDVLRFVKSLEYDNEGIKFKYSLESAAPSLYASAYACMTLSLLNELQQQSSEKKLKWKTYFDSFQREDGLFYDPAVANEHYDNSDWWGARHLALHMISAYTDLNARPEHPFRFLTEYYDTNRLKKWFEENEKNFYGSMDHDFDNRLMNIGCLLQFQRDVWNDAHAGRAVKFIQDYLLKKINPVTGLWGDNEIADPDIRSRKVQFAYHLLPIFFYDNVYSFDLKKLVDVVLKTQNRFGGFGVPSNSSACEDIDSIDILIRLARFRSAKDPAIISSMQSGLNWILLNQMDDGGFVFRLNERFVYGHHNMSSGKNTGAIFPTWFRTLTIAYLCNFLEIENDFKITRCPGYEF